MRTRAPFDGVVPAITTIRDHGFRCGSRARPGGRTGRLALRGGAWFRGGGVELHLGAEEEFRPDRKGHPGILVDDIDDVAARLARGGYPARWDDEFPGYRRIYSHDPFGNRLEFLQEA